MIASHDPKSIYRRGSAEYILDILALATEILVTKSGGLRIVKRNSGCASKKTSHNEHRKSSLLTIEGNPELENQDDVFQDVRVGRGVGQAGERREENYKIEKRRQ